VQIGDSAKVFVQGPVWRIAGAVSGLTTAIGLVRAVNGEAFWMWLFFAALALVVASFWSFHRSRVRSEERERELPSAMERLLQKGMDKLDRMVAAQKADPQRMGPWNEQEEEAWEFFGEARQLLIDHDKRSLLDDLAEGTNDARHREREKQRRPFEELTEREEAGEKVKDAEKMRVWGQDLRRSSIGEMESILKGVSVVAKHVQS
jgi:hypothetical protein